MRRLFWSFLTARGIDLKQSKGRLLLSILRPHNREDRSYLQHYSRFFPHVRFDHLRPGDVIRIPLQLLWLALVRTTPRPAFFLPWWKQYDWHWRAELHCWLIGNITAKIKRRTDQLHTRIRPVADHFRQISEEYAKHRCWDYPVIRYLVYGVSILLAFLCVTTHLDVLDQLIFASSFLVIALIARRVPGQAITFLLAGLSIIVSSRYFWWRVSSTLSLDENIDLAWGLVLLAAEFYTWFILLIGYFRICWPVKRPAVELPIQSDQWPSVDALIPTHNESLHGVARIILLTAPLAFLLFQIYVIYAPAILLALYALPHMAHATIVNSRIQGRNRFSFLATVYETVLSWHIARHIMAVFRNPRKEACNLTAQGSSMKSFDLAMLTPFILLAGLNLIGFIAGLNHLYLSTQGDVPTIVLNLAWAFYNLLFLGATMTVILEFKKIRTTGSKYRLREVLAMGFMGYYYLSKRLLSCLTPFTCRLSRFRTVVATYLPRSPKLSSE